MKTITISENHAADIHDVPIPELQDGRVLVQIMAVAVSPTDSKAIFVRNVPGVRSGYDYVGIVQKVGDKVGKTHDVGDRIAGLIHGA